MPRPERNLPEASSTVAYQGEPGAYSEEASLFLFPGRTPRGFPVFEAVFDALCSGEVTHAVTPVENSVFGTVHPVFDLLLKRDVRIVGETWRRIRLCLMALPGVRREEVREVRSHPQALGQSRTFLREKLPHAAIVEAHDTAGSARIIAEEGLRDVAAVASRHAAEQYGMEVLAEGIEDVTANFTRFLTLVRPEDATLAADGGPLKTTLLFTPHGEVPHALARLLDALSSQGAAVQRIEPRPLVGQPGRYRYALDAAGRVETEGLRVLVEEIRVLGLYPAAPPPITG